ncbi:MAG: GFA family protein [Pseudomonadota bacterium]
MTALSGRCFCGAVAWATEGPVLWAGHCHCESCRRATSAPFTSYLGVPRDSVTWQGDLSDHQTSGGRVLRQFCGLCGTQMTYHSAAWPDETHLYAATLDDQTRFIPEAHFHWAERRPWVRINDDLPKHDGSADA